MSRPRNMPEVVVLDTDRAACHPSHFDGEYQTELFFSDNITRRQQAIAICKGCELRQVCLTAARARHEEWGIWGGHIFRRGREFVLDRARYIASPSNRS